MESVSQRFLRYVSFDTQSDETSTTCPTTAKQKLLGAALVEEMKDMGIAHSFMDLSLRHISEPTRLGMRS